MLLTHHKVLNRWLHLGGHADGESNILNVALREAKEESGINGIKPLNNQIFDVDVHPIPEYKKRSEPAHFHYDIRYILIAPITEFSISDESDELKWFSIKEMKNYQWNESVGRMIRKWEKLLG